MPRELCCASKPSSARDIVEQGATGAVGGSQAQWTNQTLGHGPQW